jgi:hypothetical protein
MAALRQLFAPVTRALPDPDPACKQYDDAEFVLLMQNRERYIDQSANTKAAARAEARSHLELISG